MRYRLRTLLILLAVLPPLVATGWGSLMAWRAEQARQQAIAAEKARLAWKMEKARIDDLNEMRARLVWRLEREARMKGK